MHRSQFTSPAPDSHDRHCARLHDDAPTNCLTDEEMTERLRLFDTWRIGADEQQMESDRYWDELRRKEERERIESVIVMTLALVMLIMSAFVVALIVLGS